MKSGYLCIFGLCLVLLLGCIIFTTSGETSSEKDANNSNDLASNDLFGKPHAEQGHTRPNPCPSPSVVSVLHGQRRCVLTKNEVITKPIVLTGSTVLDCRNYTLTPAPSNPPQVAIFMKDFGYIYINRCKVRDFDFGIFAINGKSPGSTSTRVIRNNDIRTRYAAISLMSVDNTRIVDNTLSFTTKGGRAIYVGRDSDNNDIDRNTISADFSSAAVGAYRAPGPELTSNPKLIDASAIHIGHIEGNEPTLITAVIDGQVYSLPITKVDQVDLTFSQDNRFRGNNVDLTGKLIEGLSVSPAKKITVWNNVFKGGTRPVRSGVQTAIAGLSRDFPGTCSLDASRRCLDDADCAVVTNAGTCQGKETIGVRWVGTELNVLNNTISEANGSGINVASSQMTIAGNTISGPSNGGGIVLVGKYALETAVVQANKVSGVFYSLVFVQRMGDIVATEYKADVSRNDFIFTNAGVAVRLRNITSDPPGDYTIPNNELSTLGKGNYWGTPCGVGLPPEKVMKLPQINLTDSHYYGTSIASSLRVLTSGQVSNKPGVTPPSPCTPGLAAPKRQPSGPRRR